LEEFVIVVEPVGGLGNQLFIYGLGLATSRRLAVPLVADTSRIEHDKKRNLELSSFSNSLAVIESRGFSPGGLGFHSHRILRSKLGGPGQHRNFYYETYEGFDPRFLEIPDGSRLRGYFQSWRYVESVETQLRSELWNVIHPSVWFEEQKTRLTSMGDWLGVHVRIGDYKALPGMPVSEIYYKRALDLQSRLAGTEQIIVFSDEIEVAKGLSVWRQFPNVTFFDSPAQASPLETMLLMSLASHLVIANSTFSWWAAWIGTGEHRRIVFPRPWGNTVYENRDLAPPEWIGLGR
jgi:hypothetical protein